MKTLVIVEGPAGSGKTTLARQLQKDLGIAVTKGPLEVSHSLRNFGADAPEISMLVDLNKMLGAFRAFDHVIDTVALDRWGLSQWVYGHLRRQQAPDPMLFGRDRLQFEGYLGYLLMCAEAAAVERRWRRDFDFHIDFYKPRPTSLFPFQQILFILNLPSASMINIYRSTASRDFPFEAAKELDWYRTIIEYAKVSAFTRCTVPIAFAGLEYGTPDRYESAYADLKDQIRPLIADRGLPR